MHVDLTIKNYRCFPDSSPAKIAIRKGFTAFLGPNNSGKSSLLRFFYEFRNLFSFLSGPGSGSFLGLLRGETHGLNLLGVQDIPEIYSNLNNRDMSLEFDFQPTSDEPPPVDATLSRLSLKMNRGQNTFSLVNLHTVGNGNVAPSQALQFMNDGAAVGANGVLSANVAPIQDALRPLANTVYLAAFRNAINAGGQQEYYDIQVGQQFLKTWKDHKTGKVKYKSDAAIRLTQDICRIFGFNSLEINTSADDTTLLVAIDGRTFRLDELGSGLSQFILVLATIATRQQDFILLDEPELNLHPSLQIDFLTTVTSYAREGVLFGTHSIGLARAVGQQVYALRREKEGLSRIRLYNAIPRLAEFLGELSFSGYRELGFQKVLLVEGPTEVTTVQQWLRLLGKDHTIVLLPLGGNTMINGNREVELSEVCRISTDVHALIDSERAAAGAPLAADRQAFTTTCAKLGIHCHVLDRRALENYLPDRAIKDVKGNTYSQLQPYDRLADVQNSWGKAENWRIARAMTEAELTATSDLGAFIQAL
jgi:ABC-type cobalamin/Fe3+-siderophores transport system ATPase subunit